MNSLIRPEKLSKNIAKYLVFKFYFYGDSITNLRIQKLIYYVYVWYLVLKRKKAFKERFQAWPIGPVLPSIYRDLKSYTAGPINPNYSSIENEKNLEELKRNLGKDLLEIIDKVFEEYGRMSAFDLVNLTHSELPWRSARKGLEITEKSSNEIKDSDILSFYGEKIKKRK